MYAGKANAPSATLSFGEKIIGDKTLGYTHFKFSKFSIPIKLSNVDFYGELFKTVGYLSFYDSMQDNLSGKYSKGEAALRVVIDISSFGITTFAITSGGWTAVLGGLAVGGISEGAKWFINETFNK